MLINCDTKTIIYTPFKNYSTSLHEYFGDLDGWEEFVGIHPRIDGDCYDCDPNYNITYKHTNKPPSVYKSYKRILPLRNPYDRVMSMWAWTNMEFGGVSFESFFFRGAKYPAAFPAARIYPYDFIVRTENIKEDFEKAGIDIDMSKFPHSHESTYPITAHKYTEFEKSSIYWWHKEDFDAGNYEKNKF
jgi:hypothetical protein